MTAPFDPERIDIESRTTTVDLLVSRLRSDMIDLAPGFRRRAGGWTGEKQSRLIESLLLRIPVPPLYAVERRNGGWAVVDGVQRLTAIARFLDAGTVGASPLALSGLEYLPDLTGAGCHDRSGGLRTRLRETGLVVHVIRPGTPEPTVLNIAARVGTG